MLSFVLQTDTAMLEYVYVEGQRAVSVRFLWEWTAAYNTEYVFSLGGSEEEWYSIVKNGGTFDCVVIPWSELPSENIE